MYKYIPTLFIRLDLLNQCIIFIFVWYNGLNQ